MVIQNTPTKIDKIASLRIGQRGENLATDIKMDVSDWIAVHSDANYYCLFKRPDEVQVQPVLSSLEEDVLTWTVRAWECAVIGVGYLEVRAVNPDTGLVAKSRVIPCAIEDSVIDDEGPVPPEMSWVGEVLAAKDTAVAAKTAAEEARDTAQTTVNGAIAGIQAEGQTQVGVVQAEGTTQVGAVQAKGTEVLNSIPSDYTELSDDVTGLKSALNNNVDVSTLSWELGAFGADGIDYASNNRIKSDYFYALEGTTITVSGLPNSLVVFAIDVNGDVVDYTGWIDNSYTVPQGVNKIKLLIRKGAANLTIDESEISDQAARCFVKYRMPQDTYIGFDNNLKERSLYDVPTQLSQMVVRHINILSGKSYLSGKYWSHGAMTQGNSATANAYNVIEIKAGIKYYYKYIYAYFCNIVYDDNTIQALSDNTSNAISGNFTATQDGKLYITVHSNYLSTAILTDSKGVYDGSIIAPAYTPNKLITGASRVYIVDINGNGDFTTITEALAEATKYNDSIIYLNAGEYDIASEYGSVLETVSTGVGLVLKNRAKIIGSPKAVIKFNYTGSNAYVKRNFSVFNANEKGFTLENVNIEASNIRYCVHDELNGYNDPYHNSYVNCSMKLDNTQNDEFSSTQCIGGGLGLNGKIDIHDCYFKSEVTDWGNDVVSYHNSTAANAQGRIDMTGCYFDGADARARFSWHGDSTLITLVYVHGNSFGKAIYINKEVSSDVNNNIKVVQWGNEIRNA